jgi:MerR family mercuric resistance operon transcriptional regulator
MPQADSVTIGAVAKAAGVNVETIRYYQRRGLLAQPEKALRGIRRYGQSDIERLIFVKSAQRLGFTLDEVALLLKLDDGTHCSDAKRIAQHKLAQVRSRIADLSRMERALAALVARCQTQRGNVACPLIDALHDAAPADQPRADRARTQGGRLVRSRS